MPIVWRLSLSLVAAAGLAGCGFSPSGTAPIDAAAGDGAPADGPADGAPGIDACVPRAGGELCNGLDDDCDGNVDEGFGVGAACDGPDADQCDDDVTVCAADGMSAICGGPAPDDDAELCDGLDNDCDGQTDEDFQLGVACDGADSDACAEGVWACDAAMVGRTCTDTTGDTLEVCGGGDEDCDGTTDEGFDLTSDAANCGACGRVCADTNATNACASSTCVPACAVGANDCDGDPADGCELRDTNPTCAAPPSLGTVNGDDASPDLTTTGYGEAHYQVTIHENRTGGGSNVAPLRARVTLTSPPGTNFDLDVTCNACNGTSHSSSTTGVDTVGVVRADNPGDSSYTIGIHVRWVSSTVCGDWTLRIEGEVGADDLVCN
ncbi:MAG: MopE-related protein [Kofleriaceae bacterium]